MLARVRDVLAGAGVLAIAAAVALGYTFSRFVEIALSSIYSVHRAQPDFPGEGVVRRFALAFGDHVLELGPTLVALATFLVALGVAVFVLRSAGAGAGSTSAAVGRAPLGDAGAPSARTGASEAGPRR